MAETPNCKDEKKVRLTITHTPPAYGFRIHNLIPPQFCSGTGKWNSIPKFSVISVGRKKYKANALSWLLPAKRPAAAWQQSSLTLLLCGVGKVIGCWVPPSLRFNVILRAADAKWGLAHACEGSPGHLLSPGRGSGKGHLAGWAGLWAADLIWKAASQLLAGCSPPQSSSFRHI